MIRRQALVAPDAPGSVLEVDEPATGRPEDISTPVDLQMTERVVRWAFPVGDEDYAHPNVMTFCGHVYTDPEGRELVLDSSTNQRWRFHLLSSVVIVDDDNWPVGKPKPPRPATSAPAAANDQPGKDT